MFEQIAQALLQTTQEMLSVPPRFAAHHIAWQRDVFLRLVSSFAALRVCELALRSAYQEMHDVSLQKTVPTKVIMRQRLQALQRGAEEFGQATICVFALQHKQPQFLHSPYIIKIFGPPVFWHDTLHIIHLFGLLCPEIALENGRATYMVRYPLTNLSGDSIDIVSRTKHRDDTSSDYEKRARILKEIQACIEYAVIDVRDSALLADSIASTPALLAAIEAVRMSYADTIRSHYPMDMILS